MSTPARLSSRRSARDEREVAARRGRPAGGELGLAERDDELRQRQPRDDAAQAERSPRRSARAPRRSARARRAAGAYAGTPASAAPNARARRAEPPALELEVAEQRLDVGDVLRRAAAGADGAAHRRRGAREVAVQLAQVRHARVRRERRLEVDEVLQLALRDRVAAELDVRVDEDRVRRERAGMRGGGRARRAASAPAKSWRASASCAAPSERVEVRGLRGAARRAGRRRRGA